MATNNTNSLCAYQAPDWGGDRQQTVDRAGSTNQCIKSGSRHGAESRAGREQKAEHPVGQGKGRRVACGGIRQICAMPTKKGCSPTDLEVAIPGVLCEAGDGHPLPRATPDTGNHLIWPTDMGVSGF